VDAGALARVVLQSLPDGTGRSLFSTANWWNPLCGVRRFSFDSNRSWPGRLWHWSHLFSIRVPGDSTCIRQRMVDLTHRFCVSVGGAVVSRGGRVWLWHRSVRDRQRHLRRRNLSLFADERLSTRHFRQVSGFDKFPEKAYIEQRSRSPVQAINKVQAVQVSGDELLVEAYKVHEPTGPSVDQPDRFLIVDTKTSKMTELPSLEALRSNAASLRVSLRLMSTEEALASESSSTSSTYSPSADTAPGYRAW
jgi:hypothetical protein